MAWNVLSFHFKQTYEGGYRYLDRCGEFMCIAADSLGFLPGEAKPTGAKMEIPELGINLVCDSNILGLSQELPTKGDNNFIAKCVKCSDLAWKLFNPRSIIRNGLALKAYWPYANLQDLLAGSLKWGGDYHGELAKVVEMPAEQKKLDFTFVSGNKELHFTLQPVTFDRPNLSKQNISSQLNRFEKQKVDRRNVFAERLGHSFNVAHGLMLEVDLAETDPPADASLEKQFDELQQKGERLMKLFG
jgi:hypothetical protein